MKAFRRAAEAVLLFIAGILVAGAISWGRDANAAADAAGRHAQVWTPETIEAAVEERIDKSFPPDFKTLLLNDLKTLGALEDEEGSPLHRSIFQGPVSGQTYLTYFFRLTELISFDASGGEPEPDKSFVIAYAQGPSYSAFTPLRRITFKIPYFRLSKAYRWSVLMHETRHLDQATPHVDCSSAEESPDELHVLLAGSLDGYSEEHHWKVQYDGELNGGCDTTTTGAYGVGFEFLANIARHCRNCETSMRPEAMKLALDSLKRLLHVADRERLKADIFTREEQAEMAFRGAIYEDAVPPLAHYLSLGAARWVDSSQWLAIAAAGCHTEAMRALLQSKDIDPNAPDRDGFTPLGRAIHGAVAAGKPECLDPLLQAGADVNRPGRMWWLDSRQASPLSIALLESSAIWPPSARASLQVLKMLLAAGASPSALSPDEQQRLKDLLRRG